MSQYFRQVIRLAPEGWKKEHLQTPEPVQPYVEESAYSVSNKESLSRVSARDASTWAKLIAQRKILRHLIKIGRLPPGFDQASMN